MKFNKELINCNQVSNILFTIDADWAPDFMIEKIANIFLDNNLPATFFVTHKSNYLKDLLTDKNFEIGIHFYKFAYKDEKVQKKHDKELTDFYHEIRNFYNTNITIIKIQK